RKVMDGRLDRHLRKRDSPNGLALIVPRRRRGRSGIFKNDFWLLGGRRYRRIEPSELVCLLAVELGLRHLDLWRFDYYRLRLNSRNLGRRRRWNRRFPDGRGRRWRLDDG